MYFIKLRIWLIAILAKPYFNEISIKTYITKELIEAEFIHPTFTGEGFVMLSQIDLEGKWFNSSCQLYVEEK